MWAYSNLPNQTILTEAKWLKAFFALSLVANAVATRTFLAPNILRAALANADDMPQLRSRTASGPSTTL